jgi:putative transposase
MPGKPHPELPWPRSWPRRIRSAVLQAISLAHYSLSCVRARAAHHSDVLVRLRQENDRLRQELNFLGEEMRLKDARMERLPAHQRPHYHPIERLAILELRAARGWSADQVAERMLVTPATVAAWMGRLDEKGPVALVQTIEPVNKYPLFVAYLVRRLKVLCPAMGKARIAGVLCRAGLHLSSTTVDRMLKDRPRREPEAVRVKPKQLVRSRFSNEVWHIDLTTVPTSLGFWAAWIPFALPQQWPFCWWVAIAVDHYSRRILGFEIFDQQPKSMAVWEFFSRLIRRGEGKPRHLITDQGTQFTDEGFCRWCRRQKIRQRFGAVGKYGSISVIERAIRSMKNEGTRKILVPFSRSGFRTELGCFVDWYNSHRPHSALNARTPDEVYYNLRPACLAPRFEPRRK